MKSLTSPSSFVKAQRRRRSRKSASIRASENKKQPRKLKRRMGNLLVVAALTWNLREKHCPTSQVAEEKNPTLGERERLLQLKNIK